MKLSKRSITALRKVINGDDGEFSIYRSGPILIDLFSEHGFEDSYREGFPSRWYYTEECLNKINGSSEIDKLICNVLHPANFIDVKNWDKKEISYLNEYLKYDGYEIEINGKIVNILKKTEGSVELKPDQKGIDDVNYEFIVEQIDKCKRKLEMRDYDGAITNARSLLETVLLDIHFRIKGEKPEYDGNLPKLYKTAHKMLNLDPSKKDLEDCLKQILSGLISIVSGTAGASNKLGDRHARKYKPARHHAVLSVNATMTAVNFLWDTFRYQKEKGTL
ncbi:MAG: abortive infection family protein [candidate division Zixibacteria bacterium]|nr:abortive infection family protein [candidate division Zixibacteria bacterium]